MLQRCTALRVTGLPPKKENKMNYDTIPSIPGETEAEYNNRIDRLSLAAYRQVAAGLMPHHPELVTEPCSPHRARQIIERDDA